MRYRTKYKCRYCKELFYGMSTGSDTVALESINELDSILTATHIAHDYSENPHFGLGDLIGFEISGVEDPL